VTVNILGMRVEMRNEPGSLAAVAATIARLGGNILDVDVHEIDGHTVADELVIEMPAEVTPAKVRSSMLEAGASEVSSTTLHHRVTDSQVRCLEAVRQLMTHDVAPVAALARALSALVPADEVRVSNGEGAAEGIDDGDAMGRGTPVATLTDGGGVRRWILAVPYPEHEPSCAVVLERTGSRFSATEIARARALLRVHAELESANGGSLLTEERA
jgi:hypothetical protein